MSEFFSGRAAVPVTTHILLLMGVMGKKTDMEVFIICMIGFRKKEGISAYLVLIHDPCYQHGAGSAAGWWSWIARTPSMSSSDAVESSSDENSESESSSDGDKNLSDESELALNDAGAEQDKIYIATGDDGGVDVSDEGSDGGGDRDSDDDDEENTLANLCGRCSGSVWDPAQSLPREPETIKRKRKTARITINLDHCDYDVVADVCAALGWRVVTGRARWSIKWADRYMLGTAIRDMRLRAGQRINHFPAVCELAFKCRLATNLNRARRLLPAEFGFHPDTWVLPDELHTFARVTAEHRNRTYIVKPNGGSQVRAAIPGGRDCGCSIHACGGWRTKAPRTWRADICSHIFEVLCVQASTDFR
jgi:hypothetical protein